MSPTPYTCFVSGDPILFFSTLGFTFWTSTVLSLYFLRDTVTDPSFTLVTCETLSTLPT